MRRATLSGRSTPDRWERRGAAMADLAYAVLVIAVFSVLALCVRGLDRL
ncbi:hypothetical protein [Actinokineospora inagensis]|nr:hypothetical protein [Actinokineospora inagensis]